MDPISNGPVAYWRPVGGVRHGMLTSERPYPGEERKALCGEPLLITNPRDEDWLSPTCATCWAEAKALRDKRSRR